MVSAHERRKIMNAYQHEPVCVAAVLLKCVAGLLVIGGLAIIGNGVESTGGDTTQAQMQIRGNAAPFYRATLNQPTGENAKPVQQGVAAQVLPINAVSVTNQK